MGRYLIRQTLLSLLKLFVFISFMFFFVQVMMPGDYVDQSSFFCNADCREELRARLGLDLPIWQRYLIWLKQIVTLDLGTSFNGDPVVDIFKNVIPPTLLVFVAGTLIAFLIGMYLGTRTAWLGSGVISRITTIGGLTLFTSFPPWLTWLVSYVFVKGASFVVMGEIGGLGALSFQGLDRLLWMESEISPSTISLYMVLSFIASSVIFLTIDTIYKRITNRRTFGIIYLLLVPATAVASWYLFNFELFAFDIMELAWIPLLTYVLLTFGETMIIMQSSMIDVMKSEYITTARAKGLAEEIVRENHAARNALLPVLSRLVISLPYLITGVVIIESSVAWPGMGTSMWNALYWQNMPIVMNTLLIVGVLSLVARLILDVLSAYLDPRIRFDEKKVKLS